VELEASGAPFSGSLSEEGIGERKYLSRASAESVLTIESGPFPMKSSVSAASPLPWMAGERRVTYTSGGRACSSRVRSSDQENSRSLSRMFSIVLSVWRSASRTLASPERSRAASSSVFAAAAFKRAISSSVPADERLNA